MTMSRLFAVTRDACVARHRGAQEPDALEGTMAILMLADASEQQLAPYDQVIAALEAVGQGHPPGRQFHVAARLGVRADAHSSVTTHRLQPCPIRTKSGRTPTDRIRGTCN